MNDNRIADMTQSLQIVNKLIERFKAVGTLTLEEQRQLLDVCNSIGVTNSIISYAEEAAHRDIEGLYRDAEALLMECKRFHNSYDASRNKLTAFGTYQLCQEKLKTFKETWDKQRLKTLEVWQEYSSLSNRLDFMDMQDPEFSTLDKECDDKKAEHTEAKRLTDELWAKYKEEEQNVISTDYYNITFFEMLVERLEQISSSIISDIERIRKEDSHED